MFISLTFFRILMRFLRLYIYISPSLFYIFINIIFKNSLFICTQVSFEYLRHLVIVNFCSICVHIIFKKKKQNKTVNSSTPKNIISQEQKKFCTANQLSGVYVRATLALNGLRSLNFYGCILVFSDL